MPPRRQTVPSYLRHKASGQAISIYRDPVTGAKRTAYLGRHGSAASRQEHARICAEVAASDLSVNAQGGIEIEASGLRSPESIRDLIYKCRSGDSAASVLPLPPALQTPRRQSRLPRRQIRAAR
jgi:hypothetical protein